MRRSPIGLLLQPMLHAGLAPASAAAEDVEGEWGGEVTETLLLLPPAVTPQQYTPQYDCALHSVLLLLYVPDTAAALPLRCLPTRPASNIASRLPACRTWMYRLPNVSAPSDRHGVHGYGDGPRGQGVAHGPHHDGAQRGPGPQGGTQAQPRARPHLLQRQGVDNHLEGRVVEGLWVMGDGGKGHAGSDFVLG